MKSITYLLQELNFTESEAKVYIALLENGACTGYEASKNSGVARSKIYNILENLLKKGAVAVGRNEKVTLYRAVSVEHLIETIRGQVEESLDMLKQGAQELAEPCEDEHVWHVYDWNAVKSQCIKMIQEAKQQVAIQIWTSELDEKIEECILRKQKELSQVVVVLYDKTERYETKLTHLYKHGFEKDKLDEMGGHWLLVETDNQKMLYAAFSEKEMREAFYTSNRYMALFAKEYVFHDAYCLRLIDRLHEHVKSEFGRNMEGVREIYTL